MGRRVCEWVFVREGRCGQERGCCGVKVGRVVVVVVGGWSGGKCGEGGRGGGGGTLGRAGWRSRWW